ncbi:MAG: stage II sporulation protein P [Clostridia bacterium]|nr:stage II sporulation protein P [Clostridia bacterium]
MIIQPIQVHILDHFGTVQNLLANKNTELVIDLHRDAVGSSNTYAPTVKINGNYAAQMMFVIGTDGGGLEHPNWNQNLKIAIKIQEKANEIYPGLFRPIIVRNSRYNQHVAKGACIIEVGATGNTLDECILSMQCLANIIEEVCK